MLAGINWYVSPEIFKLGPFSVRWYGLLFAMAFVAGYRIMSWIFLKEKQSSKDLETLTITMIIGTVVGARLGHCLFYDPVYYLSNPLEILMVWKGGLASHGAAIGILIAIWLFIRKRPYINFIWMMDRISIVVALSGFFIRIGNFLNGEILGKPADVPWSVVFYDKIANSAPNKPEWSHTQPLHPVQIYESLTYLAIFLFLFFQYKKKKQPNGYLFGLFLVFIFGARFIIEFFKDVQVDFEHHLPIDMGQILSIPFVIAGCYFIWRSKQKKNTPEIKSKTKK